MRRLWITMSLARFALGFSLVTPVLAQQDLQIWRAFVLDLRSNQLTEDHLRPLYISKPVMQQ